MCRLTFVCCFFFEHQLETRFINQLPWEQSFYWCIFLCVFCCFSNSFRHLQGKKNKKVCPNMPAFFYSLVHLLKKNTKNSHSYSIDRNKHVASWIWFYFRREYQLKIIWVEHLSGTQWKKVKQDFWLSYVLHIFWGNINFNVTCFS